MDVALFDSEDILVSWNIAYKNLHDFIEEVPEFQAGDPAQDQLKAARTAVKGLIDSGCIGSLEHDYRVSISGHSNPDHDPAQGMANDAIQLSIYQIAREKK